jgi:hypothetical protein
VSGAHRGKGDTSFLRAASTTGGLKTLGALVALAAVCTVFLALLGLAVYIAIRYPARQPAIVIAVQSLAWIWWAVQLAGNLRRGRTRSPKELVERMGHAAWLAGWTAVLLSSVGEQQGWLHGITEYILVGICSLFVVGIPVSWFGGKRRLIAVMTARTAARQGPV